MMNPGEYRGWRRLWLRVGGRGLLLEFLADKTGTKPRLYHQYLCLPLCVRDRFFLRIGCDGLLLCLRSIFRQMPRTLGSLVAVGEGRFCFADERPAPALAAERDLACGRGSSICGIVLNFRFD